MEGENKTEAICNTANMEQRPAIFLFLRHGGPEMSHSMYMIEPPLDLSGYDQMIDSEGYMLDKDSKYISPIKTFQNNDEFLRYSAFVNLGSRIYFFGGAHKQVQGPSDSDHERAMRVQVYDTDCPGEGTFCVASMNAPKESPCVFVADSMIYALGSPLPYSKGKPTSLFERYNPCSNRWEVLPDPPFPIGKGTVLLNCATVLGRWVYIAQIDAIFNLDTLTWDPRPPPEMSGCLPYSFLFVQESASLYHLFGAGARKSPTAGVSRGRCSDPLKVLKRSPVTTSTEGDYVNSFLKSARLISGKEQVMAEGLDLDEDIFFTESCYHPWRDLFHMGGQFFCYVVTAQLVEIGANYPMHGELNSRGVWIRFFEEVTAHSDNCNGNNCNCNKSKFRQVASFCYKIVTSFHNSSLYTCCSVLGTVPDSWINTPQKFKQEWKPKRRIPDNRKPRNYNLKTLLAAKEDENSRLRAELEKKNEILKAYEALLAKTGGMVNV